MTINRLCKACEPTQLLQTVLKTYVDINQPNTRTACRQRIFQGVLLTSAAFLGVTSCASEGLSLVADIFYKAEKRILETASNLVSARFLENWHNNIPSRPDLSSRIERIASQAVGVVVSVCGTLFLLAIKTDWVVHQHRSLENYTARAPRRPPPSRPEPTSATAPPVPPTRSLEPPAAPPRSLIAPPARPPRTQTTAASPERLSSEAGAPSYSAVAALHPANARAPDITTVATSAIPSVSASAASSSTAAGSPPPPPPPPLFSPRSTALSPPAASATAKQPTFQELIAAKPELIAAKGVQKNQEEEPVPAAPTGKLNTMGRALVKRFAGARGSVQGILFEQTNTGYRFGGEWPLKDLKNEYGLNFPITDNDDFEEDTLDSYLFNHNKKVGPKTSQKFDFNIDKQHEAFRVEIEKTTGNLVEIVKITLLLGDVAVEKSTAITPSG